MLFDAPPAFVEGPETGRGGPSGPFLESVDPPRSGEAEAAVAIFERYRDKLVMALDACGSGRELDGRGHHDDKFIAGQLDVSGCVPRFEGVGFVDGRGGRAGELGS